MQRKQAIALRRKAEAQENCGPRLKPKRAVRVQVKMRGHDGTVDKGAEFTNGYIRFQ